jgi:hypothetical protein
MMNSRMLVTGGLLGGLTLVMVFAAFQFTPAFTSARAGTLPPTASAIFPVPAFVTWTPVFDLQGTGDALQAQYAAEAAALEATATARAGEYAGYSATATANGVLIERLLQNEPVVMTPLPWPMPALTPEQVAEARACAFDVFYDYWGGGSSRGDDLPLDPPQTPCDWAVVAAAYAVRDFKAGLPPSDWGRRAFVKAAAVNPALLLRNELALPYLGTVKAGEWVAAPPIAAQPITWAELEYKVTTGGYQAEITLVIAYADSEPRLVGRVVESGGPNGTRILADPIDPALIQNLAAALTDLVPVASRDFYASGCGDYTPRWSALLATADGREARIRGAGNLWEGGGPWTVGLDGQSYLQISDAFPKALAQVAAALRLPGAPSAKVTCPPPGSLLDLTFPWAQPQP